ncbi:MAG: hypothetical protein RMJ04_00285 [Geminicoccaceae bacterium]|nr:hypothetical protein [Geminicoccaceae bacterium]
MRRKRAEPSSDERKSEAPASETLEGLALRCLGLADPPEEPKRKEAPVLRLEELLADDGGAIFLEANGVSAVVLETSAPVRIEHTTPAPSGTEGSAPLGCIVLGSGAVLYFPAELDVHIIPRIK